MKKTIMQVLQKRKNEIVDIWYSECTHLSKSFSKNMLISMHISIIDMICNSFIDQNDDDLKKLAKEMGIVYADKHICVSDIFMNFKIFRRVLWCKLKECVEIPRRSEHDRYDYGNHINHVLDELYYWLTVYYDQRLKEKLRDSQEQIESLQQDKRIKELKLKQMHEQKLEVIGQLAAGMAHELRNPLTSIKGFLQLIHKEHSHPERVKSYFDIISKEFDRLHVLLNHFLTLARRNHSSEQIKEVISLNKVLQKMIEFIQFEVIYRSIDFQTDIEPNLLPVTANEAELEQVFLNLLKNAFEAVQDHKEKIVHVQAENEDSGYVRISIFNTGDTIPPELMDKIFEPFFSLKSTGTGLGLAICKQIIDSNQGEIHIHSSEQDGTKITIRLPSQTVY